MTVVAASTPDDKEHEWATENLEGVKTYHNYEEMLEKEKRFLLQEALLSTQSKR